MVIIYTGEPTIVNTIYVNITFWPKEGIIKLVNMHWGNLGLHIGGVWHGWINIMDLTLFFAAAYIIALTHPPCSTFALLLPLQSLVPSLDVIYLCFYVFVVKNGIATILLQLVRQINSWVSWALCSSDTNGFFWEDRVGARVKGKEPEVFFLRGITWALCSSNTTGFFGRWDGVGARVIGKEPVVVSFWRVGDMHKHGHVCWHTRMGTRVLLVWWHE